MKTADSPLIMMTHRGEITAWAAVVETAAAHAAGRQAGVAAYDRDRGGGAHAVGTARGLHQAFGKHHGFGRDDGRDRHGVRYKDQPAIAAVLARLGLL